MRFVAVCISAISIFPSNSQQVAGSQAYRVLHEAISALESNIDLTDISLSGSVRRISGSDDEIGSVTVKLLSSGAYRIDFLLPSGQRTETRAILGQTATGAWSDAGGTPHAIAHHNLVNDCPWFPTFSLASAAISSNMAVTLIGTEKRDDRDVLHISTSRQFADLPPKEASLMQHLSQVDFYLDAVSLFPVAVTYNIHPDNDALVDIPVEMQFSDYRSSSGIKIPFHIQRFINRTLDLDVQIQSAVVNSGLSYSSISSQ